MNIKSFLFNNGYEVIGDVVSGTDNIFTVNKPLVVRMIQGSDGAPTLAFSHVSMVQDPDKVIEIFKNSLMMNPADVNKEVQDAYIQSTTGIILPGAQGSIIT